MNMSWVWVLLALVVIAAIFGFGGIVGAAAQVVQILFWVLLVAFVIGLIMGLTGRRRTVV